MSNNFENEDLENFGELEHEEFESFSDEELEALTTPDPEPEPEPEKPKSKSKKGFTVKAVGVNTWVFKGPSFVARGLTRVRRGNLMKVIGTEDDWYKIELPRANNEPLVGYIRQDKVELV